MWSLVYAIVLGGTLSILPLYMLLVRCLWPFLRSGTLRFVYARLPFLPRVLAPQLLLGVVFMGLNAGVLVILGLKGQARLARGAGIIATVNSATLFLGGRTNPLVDYLGVSLHVYYFAHGVVAIVAVSEALLHSGIHLRGRSNWDTLAISGGVVSTNSKNRTN